MKKISVIIPTFNEELRIDRCLRSVVKQKYPQKKLEIIVVDDNSVDKTVEIARKYKAKIIKSGFNNIERSKSLGLAHATGEYIFFIDADNELLYDDWFSVATSLLNSDREIIGVQSFKYKYYANDPVANRYCSLFGINDPMAFYLGKRGQLQFNEHSWIYPKTLLYETKDFFVCKFTPDNLPTVGSQGYMTRKPLLVKTNWTPYLFHMDSIYELVKKGNTNIAFIKREIRHDYVDSLWGVLKKLRRNIALFYQQQSLRKYKYEITPTKLLFVIIIMSTFVVPFIDAFKGFLRKPDIAWFIHPLLSFVVVVLYGYTTLENILKKYIVLK